MLTKVTWNKVAMAYQAKFMDTAMYHDGYDIFCGLVKKTDPEILEVGCGPGNVTKYILSKRPDFKIYAIDFAPNMIALAKVNNSGAEFNVMDCRDVSDIGKTFDVVISGFCLPYLTKEETMKWIASASNVLRPEGVLYLSTMEDDYNKSGIETSSQGDQMFIHYHEGDYLTDTLKKCHFEIVHLERKKYEYNGKQVTDLVIIAQLVKSVGG